MHVPGLKVVIPSNPADAKGLLAASIRDNDPVVFCAHKLLFARRGPVPEGEYIVPLGSAALARTGTDATIAATGNMVNHALEAAATLAAEGVSCEVLDLRSLVPLDEEALLASVAKTGRLLVVDEAYGTCGVGAELAAVVNERGYRYLRAPVLRLSSLAVSHPFSPVFDERVLPQPSGIVEKVRLLLEGGAAPPTHAPRPAAAALAAAPAAVAAPVAAPTAPAPPAASAVTETRVPVQIPNQGLTVEEARITRWLVAVGEQVREGEALFEIETDKVVVEVTSEADGIVDEIIAHADDTLPLGAIVAWLRPV
jgi:biotin carboxyl carrier protein